jgi:hypothetical protein
MQVSQHYMNEISFLKMLEVLSCHIINYISTNDKSIKDLIMLMPTVITCLLLRRKLVLYFE